MEGVVTNWVSKEQPRRGEIRVASHFNGWYDVPKGMRAFRYATSNPYRVPTARNSIYTTIPAIMAGYHYLMPTASSTVAYN